MVFKPSTTASVITNEFISCLATAFHCNCTHLNHLTQGLAEPHLIRCTNKMVFASWCSVLYEEWFSGARGMSKRFKRADATGGLHTTCNALILTSIYPSDSPCKTQIGYISISSSRCKSQRAHNFSVWL